MTQAQLLQEFRQLTLAQQIELLQSALEIVSIKVQGIAQINESSQSESSLTEAANLLLADYAEDAELTSFTALDGEPFHTQR